MARAIASKFQQNPELKQQLAETKPALLVEDSPEDQFWGGRGPNSLNMLGKLLMAERDGI